MGIFDELKDAILGEYAHAETAPTDARRTEPVRAPAQPLGSLAQPAGSPAQAPTSTQRSSPAQGAPLPESTPAQKVDVEAVLNEMAAKKREKLNWQSSIVDLMKLVGLDPSLENRKALASEVGYTGNPQDSASMNEWLHRKVMQELAGAGGKVPDRLRH